MTAWLECAGPEANGRCRRDARGTRGNLLPTCTWACGCLEWATTDPNVCVQVHARVAVDANPQDYGALAKWGELLLELAMTKEGDEATAKLLESIDKLEQSLKIFPDNSHAMVVLASALNARAFLQQDPDVAAGLFERSKKNFERALELDPSNSRCRQLLEAMENAPALHAQVLSLQPPPYHAASLRSLSHSGAHLISPTQTTPLSLFLSLSLSLYTYTHTHIHTFTHSHPGRATAADAADDGAGRRWHVWYHCVFVPV